jgi:hypothetical protein
MSNNSNAAQFTFSPAKMIVGTVAGVVGFVLTAYFAVMGLSAQSWTKTDAVVSDAVVGKDHKGRTTLRVEYEYTFNGQTYNTARYGFSDGESVESRIAKYVPGKTVSCFVNPKKPSQAYLSIKMSPLWFGLPFVFLGMAVFLAVMAKKSIAARKNREEQFMNDAILAVSKGA